ncbi:hypothetical protein CUMW_285270, partial [Citrus unshiu]
HASRSSLTVPACLTSFSLPHASRSLTAGLVVLRCKFNCIMLHDIFASYWGRVDLSFFLPHLYENLPRFINGSVWSLVLACGYSRACVVIIASRKHYTVDVVVAW